MAIKKGLFKTSVGRKNLMALTGLFIIFFLVIHLVGNLLLIIPDSFFPIEFWGNVANQHDMYNAYSHFLVHFWPITVVAWVLYAAIALHIIDAILITLKNWKAKGEKYVVTDNSTSTWISRNMGILGSIILIFLVIHFKDYWYVYKFGSPPIDAEGNKDLYIIVMNSFKELWYVVLYVIAIMGLGLHLIHGVSSAFRTLGVYHPKFIKWIKYGGYAFSILITIGFAIIPIITYIKQL